MYIKTNWVNDVTDVDATNMNHIEDGIEKAYGVVLLAVVDTAPSECSVGDKYFNTTTNKIYEATDTDTWDTEGYDAESGVFYVVFSERAIYTYNGTTLVGVGSSGAGGESIPVGSIIAFAGSTAPEGYLMCDGSNVSRTANNDLFNVIGTTYGQGDGSTTFGIPNIKGRVIVGLDSTQTEFDTLGETGGSKTHNHTLENGYAGIGMFQLGNATNVYLPKSGATFTGTRFTNGGTTGEGGSATLTTANASKLLGTTDDGNSLQPYIVVNYIIKAHPSAVNTSEVVNEHSTSETDVYSANYVNEAIEGTILYNNSSGTNSDITLSDNISNYSTIEFYAINSDDSDESLGIYKFETNKSKFLIQGNNVTSNSFSIFVKEYIIDTNNNKKLNASIGRLYANNQTSNYEVFKITKVIGYK